MKAIRYEKGGRWGTPSLTEEQARELLTPDEITKGEKRGRLTTRAPWGTPVGYTALAVDEKAQIIYGTRTLQDVKQLGHELEGRVEVDGKRVRGFTSSILFTLADGRLVDVAIIYVCMNQPR